MSALSQTEKCVSERAAELYHRLREREREREREW